MKKQIIKKIGEMMIKKAELSVNHKCVAFCYEVKRPECLKKTESENADNSDVKNVTC